MDPAPPTRPPDRLRRFVRRAVVAGAWLCLAVALGAWGLLRAGDAWGPATVLMFGPRWLLAVPPGLLFLVALPFRRRPAVVALAAAVVVLGPVMGLQVPWDRLSSPPPEGSLRLRVLTCNMHYGREPRGLMALVDDSRPDVVALQEWREPHGSAAPSWDGWDVRRSPGLFLASRHPVRAVEYLGRNSVSDQGLAARYDLDTPAGPVTLFSLHLASPREELKEAVGAVGLDALEANTALRDGQMAHIAEAAARVSGPVVLVGDFNTPPESRLFRRHWGAYADAFGQSGWGWGYTFFNRWTRVRIDHVLVGGGGRATDCRVGPDVGSPHRPVLADLAWPVGP